MKTVRRPPYPKWNPGYFPCSSLTTLPLSSRRPSVSFGGFGLTPFGIQGMVSHDDGKSWDESNKLLLVADAGIDQGYPSTTQRDDGTLVTVYYSSELDLRQKKPRPEILGIHGAAVLYRPEDF